MKCLLCKSETDRLVGGVYLCQGCIKKTATASVQLTSAAMIDEFLKNFGASMKKDLENGHPVFVSTTHEIIPIFDEHENIVNHMCNGFVGAFYTGALAKRRMKEVGY